MKNTDLEQTIKASSEMKTHCLLPHLVWKCCLPSVSLTAGGRRGIGMNNKIKQLFVNLKL